MGTKRKVIRMGTNKFHPHIRKYQQFRKKVLRSYGGKKMLHHTRKWWKAWNKTWEYEFKKREGEQE